MFIKRQFDAKVYKIIDIANLATMKNLQARHKTLIMGIVHATCQAPLSETHIAGSHTSYRYALPTNTICLAHEYNILGLRIRYDWHTNTICFGGIYRCPANQYDMVYLRIQYTWLTNTIYLAYEYNILGQRIQFASVGIYRCAPKRSYEDPLRGACPLPHDTALQYVCV